MSAATLAPQAILHECAGADHVAEITPAQTVKLGCGCTRGRGTRCDGTPIEWLTVVRCAYHRQDEETAAGPMRGPADATHLQREPLPRGSQRPARHLGGLGGLGVTPPQGWHWRYLPARQTRVLHALADPDDRMARCGASERGRQWRGDANQFERDRAATLPLCGRCLRYIGATAVERDGLGCFVAGGAR